MFLCACFSTLFMQWLPSKRIDMVAVSIVTNTMSGQGSKRKLMPISQITMVSTLFEIEEI